MPTSALYDSTRSTLASRLPTVRSSQLDSLSLVLVGVVQSMSAQLGKIARAMPLDTKQVVKEQRLRRLLDNPRISQQEHYQPLLRAALHGLKGQRVQLLLDRVLLNDHHNLLVLSIGFRRRSLPLAWLALEHRGKSSLADQQAVLASGLAVLPEAVRVSVHGDNEFRSCELFCWLRERQCDVMLGIYGNTHVGLSAEGPLAPLEEWLSDRSTVAYLNGMYVTEAGFGPVNLMGWWVKQDDGSWKVQAVMTNLPANWKTYRLGSRRMWIETVFRDWQSGGFQLDRCGIVSRKRVAQLLIVLAIAYLWLVSLGRWLVKKGYRRLIDDGASRAWKFSLFQLGVGWKERLASFTLAIPVILHLYV